MRQLLCIGCVGQNVYTIGVGQKGSRGTGEWQAASQVLVPFLLHETALFIQEVGLLGTCSLGRNPGNTADILALANLKR